jgi:hypothetical protein
MAGLPSPARKIALRAVSIQLRASVAKGLVTKEQSRKDAKHGNSTDNLNGLTL